MPYQSLVHAIYERYGEIGDCSNMACSINCSDFSLSGSSSSSSCSPVASPIGNEGNNDQISDNQSPLSPPNSAAVSNNFAAEISFFIPPVCSPRKTQSGLVMTSVKSLIMTDKYLNHVGDHEELENCCRNVLELDLSKNEFMCWNEIKKILNALKNLQLLNLSHNPLMHSTNFSKRSRDEDNIEDSESIEDNFPSALGYFQSEWSLEKNEFTQLEILILNACHLDLRVVEFLLERMPNLSELHLASNNYSRVTFSDKFRKQSVKILYLNNNNFSEWCEVLKFGKCFPMLENLVLSDNPLSNFISSPPLETSDCFQKLEILILNKLYISEWAVLDNLRQLPNLKHVRIQNVPLLNDYNEEQKFFLIVGHLNDTICSVNGSKITGEDKENCERKFIRHYLDYAEKPERYFFLEKRHGKLNKLAEINMEGVKVVTCKIKFHDKQILHKIDVRQTVGDFKKQLEKFVGCPSSRFKVFYIDIEACSMAIYGPEELKYPNRSLFSFNIVDGDEFEIDLKPPPVIHSASEHQFQHTTSQYHIHCHDSSHSSVTRPVNIRNRKISENSLSGESTSTARESTSFTRVTKKTKPISFFSGHSISKSANKKGPDGTSSANSDYCSLPTNLNKKNRLAEVEGVASVTEVGNGSSGSNRVVFTGGQDIDEDEQN